ncbi:MAG: serine/threonine-protein kinase [Gemmataceae bacterium]
MAAKLNRCEPDRLRDLLADRLSPVQTADLEGHLERCLNCRRLLDRLAGGDSWSSAVRDHLGGPDTADAVGPTHSELDDPLDFLAPSEFPDSLGRVGPYEVKGVLGRGGNGIVLKAFDAGLNRFVAVKVIAAVLAGSGAARKRFTREARAAAAVVHENVVAVHAVDEAGGLPYLVMEYVRGRSLQDRLDKNGPLGVAEVLRIGMQAAAGLAAAHAQGLVHRDVKPANILLENGVERVKLTDFGLARAVTDACLTQSGVITGTPHYMAPEQARGEAVDHQADLFSLGATLYATCAGHPPFRADTPLAVLRRVCDDTPKPLRAVNPEVPAWLERIIAKLMAKGPADRFQTAAEVAALFEKCLAHVQSPLTTALPDVPRQAGRGIRWVRVAGATTGLAAAVAGMALFQLPTPARTATTHAVETVATDETRRAAEAAMADARRATEDTKGAMTRAGQSQADARRVKQAVDATSRAIGPARPGFEPLPTPRVSDVFDFDKEADRLREKIALVRRTLTARTPDPSPDAGLEIELHQLMMELLRLEQELASSRR